MLAQGNGLMLLLLSLIALRVTRALRHVATASFIYQRIGRPFFGGDRCYSCFLGQFSLFILDGILHYFSLNETKLNGIQLG